MDFIAGVKPTPSQLQTPAGCLWYFGQASMSWPEVAERLAQDRFPDRLRGSFAFVWQDRHRTIAAVDHVATYPLFYSSTKISNVFAEVMNSLVTKQSNPKILFQIGFLGGQSFGPETTDKQIQRLQPGHYLRDGKQHCFIDLMAYGGTEAKDIGPLCELTEQAVKRSVTDQNVLLFSGGVDSTTIAGVIRKLNLTERFEFVHIYSPLQPLTEIDVVEQTSGEMALPLRKVAIDVSGDIVPAQRERQFSFWVENPFLSKRLAVEQAGLARHRIFTGELGDQLFGGPKNSALLNYALQVPHISCLDVATLWLNQSATYGKSSGMKTALKIEEIFVDFPESKPYYFELREEIASLFEKIPGRDFLNRIMLMNYIIKGPYRTWAYAQDDLDWVHPFADWELFDYAFRLPSHRKIGPHGVAKAILLSTWRPFVSALPWSLPKHGFGIPSRSKIRSASRDLGY